MTAYYEVTTTYAPGVVVPVPLAAVPDSMTDELAQLSQSSVAGSGQDNGYQLTYHRNQIRPAGCQSRRPDQRNP